MLEPYRPVFIGLTLLFLVLAFRESCCFLVLAFSECCCFPVLAFSEIYLVPRACTPENACAEPRVVRRQRLTFRTVTALLAALLLVPVVDPMFYR